MSRNISVCTDYFYTFSAIYVARDIGRMRDGLYIMNGKSIETATDLSLEKGAKATQIKDV